MYATPEPMARSSSRLNPARCSPTGEKHDVLWKSRTSWHEGLGLLPALPAGKIASRSARLSPNARIQVVALDLHDAIHRVSVRLST